MSFNRAERFPDKKKRSAPSSSSLTFRQSNLPDDAQSRNLNSTHPPSRSSDEKALPSEHYLSYLMFLETQIDKGVIPSIETFHEQTHRGRERTRRKKHTHAGGFEENHLTFRQGGSGEGFARYVEGLCACTVDCTSTTLSPVPISLTQMLTVPYTHSLHHASFLHHTFIHAPLSKITLSNFWNLQNASERQNTNRRTKHRT